MQPCKHYSAGFYGCFFRPEGRQTMSDGVGVYKLINVKSTLQNFWSGS